MIRVRCNDEDWYVLAQDIPRDLYLLCKQPPMTPVQYVSADDWGIPSEWNGTWFAGVQIESAMREPDEPLDAKGFMDQMKRNMQEAGITYTDGDPIDKIVKAMSTEFFKIMNSATEKTISFDNAQEEYNRLTDRMRQRFLREQETKMRPPDASYTMQDALDWAFRSGEEWWGWVDRSRVLKSGVKVKVLGVGDLDKWDEFTPDFAKEYPQNFAHVGVIWTERDLTAEEAAQIIDPSGALSSKLSRLRTEDCDSFEAAWDFIEYLADEEMGEANCIKKQNLVCYVRRGAVWQAIQEGLPETRL